MKVSMQTAQVMVQIIITLATILACEILCIVALYLHG